MARHWTFGQKLGAGFAVTVVLTIAVGVVSICALRTVVSITDEVITQDARLLTDAQRLMALCERRGSASRGFFLTGEERFVDQLKQARIEFTALLQRLKQTADTDEGRRLTDAIEKSGIEHHDVIEKVVALRRSNADVGAIVRAFDEQAAPKREQLDSNIAALVSHGERLLDAAHAAATATASSTIALVTAISAAVMFFATLVPFLLTRMLGRQIGTAVGQVQSSSAELQAAANEQATSAKEQATAVSEITTTINELLATSRQIAESAQHVAQIAERTTVASRSGEGTVDKAAESVTGIRRQVDLIVDHMLELGRKSQEIGSVLEIVAELAEQTNILAINATIEAAGAGDAGKRFGVVADEIRGLADRVAGSAKQIRGLIDDVRSAVNTTVMATETGSKSVDAGSRQFGEVAAAFKQIAGLLNTTTEAVREIELSTKQQTTAVEQVNLAIIDIAQATRETEANSGQTLQTSSQLSLLSEDLRRLVQTQGSA